MPKVSELLILQSVKLSFYILNLSSNFLSDISSPSFLFSLLSISLRPTTRCFIVRFFSLIVTHFGPTQMHNTVAFHFLPALPNLFISSILYDRTEYRADLPYMYQPTITKQILIFLVSSSIKSTQKKI